MVKFIELELEFDALYVKLKVKGTIESVEF